MPPSAGICTLGFTFDRDRWRASSIPDPAQHYQQERSIDLPW
jgi:hypothetical protein